MSGRFFLAISLVVLFGLGAAVHAQTKVRVRFARGESSVTVSGEVRGYAYKDYVVRASGGQTIDVSLDKKTKCVFTIFKAGGDNLDLAAERDEFTAELPDSGSYVIRVLMMRSDARRKGSLSHYTLTISIY